MQSSAARDDSAMEWPPAIPAPSNDDGLQFRLVTRRRQNGTQERMSHMHSISERQGAPRAALFPDAIPKALLIIVASLLASCNGTSTPPVVEVFDAGVSTITRTVTQSLPTTTIVIDNDGDAALVGKKKVRLIVIARQDITLISVLLTHWLAGHNNGSRTIEQTLNQNMSSGTSKLVTNEIPESENLGICEGRYYMWTVA
jgi:hypothetical protein